MKPTIADYKEAMLECIKANPGRLVSNVELDALAMKIASEGNTVREKRKALSQLKWRLKYGLLYAGLDDTIFHRPILVADDDALVFDGRDSQEAKLKYFEAVTGYKFEIELCAS